MPELANPTIALGIKTAEPPQSAISNPLGLIGTLAQTQSALANARRANVEAESATRQLGAREAAGLIMAHAKTFEDGVKALQANPQVMGYAPDVAATMANMDQTFTAIAGQKQSQSLTALGSIYKALAIGIEDPTMVQPALDAAGATMPPEVAQRIIPGVQKILKGLTAGLANTPEGRAKYRKGLVSAAVGSGAITSDEAYKLTGTVPPSITMQPVGPKGANVPVLTGGAPGEAPQASIVAPSGTPTAATGTSADSTGVGPGGQIHPPIQGPTIQEQHELAGKGEIVSGLIKQANEDVQIYPELLRLHKVADALQMSKMGGGANLRESAGIAMQALKNADFPITQNEINSVANSNLAGTELFKAEIRPVLLAAMRDTIKGTGQARSPEIQAFLEQMSTDTDPSVLVTQVNQLFSTLAQRYDFGSKFHAFGQMLKNGDPKVKGWSLEEYPQWYMAHLNPSEITQHTPGGLSFAPVSKGSVQGATTPNIGEVQDGYKYKGGNPADQGSWEKVQ